MLSCTGSHTKLITGSPPHKASMSPKKALVWVTKHRFKVLRGDIQMGLREIMQHFVDGQAMCRLIPQVFCGSVDHGVPIAANARSADDERGQQI